MAVQYVGENSFDTICDEDLLKRAANEIKVAEAMVIMAGARMGADSGIPTYRTNEDFWRAHPQLRKDGHGIPEMSNSGLFRTNPTLAWGFMASRLQLYRSKTPHEGYHILKRWADTKEHGYFVFTSNVDRHFLRAGFSEDRIVERHGNLEYLQCLHTKISKKVTKTRTDFRVRWDPDSLNAFPPLPTIPVETHNENCPNRKEMPGVTRQGERWILEHSPINKTRKVNGCATTADPEETNTQKNRQVYYNEDGEESPLAACQTCDVKYHAARPNMRLFNDDQWINSHVLDQEAKFHSYVRSTLVQNKIRFVIIEVGVGVTVDTVRPTTDRLVQDYSNCCTLIRINPIEPEITWPDKHVSLKMTGLEALLKLQQQMEQM